MPKMYLIRRENRVFIGPLTLEQFRDSLRTMNFGLQDEVAASCSNWVVLDNEELIRKKYPELVGIISSELPVAWREMTGHAKQITKKDQKVKASPAQERPARRASQSSDRHKSKQNQKGSNNKILISSLMIAVAAVGAGIYLKSQDESIPPVGDIAALAQKPDPSDFLNEMGLRIVPIINKINRNKEAQSAWLPYVRMYSFYTNGTVDNFSQKTLRGNLSPAAPADCSVDSWKKRWREGAPQTVAWLNGKTIARNQVTKALTWDPHWIRRRPTKGWIRPRNWYEGCLMSATVAMKSIATDPNFGADPGVLTIDVVAAVSRRLQAQLEIIQSGKASQLAEPTNTTNMMTCMEQAESVATLQKCKPKFSDQNLQLVMDDHANWQNVRFALATPVGMIVDPGLQAEITKSIAKMTAEEPMSKLDFAAELKYLQLLQQSSWKIDGIAERLNTDFPEVKLRP